MNIPMTRCRIYTLTLLLLSLVACERRQLEAETDSVMAIAFTCDVDDTKAPGEIGTMPALQDGGFGVFASYTGLRRYSESSVSSDYMHNQEVWFNTDAGLWEYSPVKFWPNVEDEKVSFFAYAPYSDGDISRPSSNPAGYCIPSVCNPREFGDPWILYCIHPDPDKQVDLLYAEPLLDQCKSEVSGKLPFAFRHALSCAGENAVVSVTDALAAELNKIVDEGGFDTVQLLLKEVTATFTLTSKARLVLWNRGQANWQSVASEDPLATRTRTYCNHDDGISLYSYDGGSVVRSSWSVNDKGVFFIPLETASQQVEIRVRYAIRTNQEGSISDSEKTASMVVSLKDYCQEGKHLDFNISLNNL